MIMSISAKRTLDEVLESAVVASWPDLSPSGSGSIHVEYRYAPCGSLDSLQIWSSTQRGHWLLACEYRMSSSAYHEAGVHFENGVRSEELGRVLALVMENQNAFLVPPNLGRPGLLQITKPNEHRSVGAGPRQRPPR